MEGADDGEDTADFEWFEVGRYDGDDDGVVGREVQAAYLFQRNQHQLRFRDAVSLPLLSLVSLEGVCSRPGT